MKNSKWLLILGLLVAFVGLPVFLAWNFVLGPVLEINAHYRSLLGKSEDEVLKTLGKPTFRISPEDAKKSGVDFQIRERGYLPTPERPVHKEALLYIERSKTTGKDFAVYVFVDNSGRVEGIDFAGN